MSQAVNDKPTSDCTPAVTDFIRDNAEGAGA